MTLTASRTMKARRAGRCPICRDAILVGQSIGKIGPGTWVHVTCTPAVRRAADHGGAR